MTLRLGRLTLEATGVKVQRATFGDGLSLGLRAHHTAADHGFGVLTLREQMMGLQGRVAPLTWTSDRTWDGFYSVRRVAADIVHAAPQDRLTVVDLSVDLEPVARGLVDFESSLVGAAMVNAHGIVGDVPWMATPGGVVDLHSDPVPLGAYSGTTEDGAVLIWVGAPSHATWATPPDTDIAAVWNAGAATIRQNLAVVTGHMVDSAPGIFELNNGLCRVRFIVGDPVPWDSLDGTWDDMGDLTWDDLEGFTGVEVATYHAGVWVARRWDLGVQPTMCTVLHNEPHVVSVRLIHPLLPGRRIVDLTLRRGARAVYGYVSGPEDVRTVMRDTAEAAVAIDGGVKASSPDASGVTYVAATTDTHSTNLPQGGFTETSDRMTFMVGATASAAANQTPEDMVKQWISHRDESVRPVLR